MKIRKEKNSGITLIALVVTIIVLIILAGIRLNLLLGDNGIIKKAGLAGEEQEKAELKEKIQLELTDKQVETKGILTRTSSREYTRKIWDCNKKSR